MRVLALDLATVTGAAVDHPEIQGAPICYTLTLPKPQHSRDFETRLVVFEEWLKMMLEAWAPDLVAWETPLMIAGKGRPADRVLVGLVSVAGLVAKRSRLRIAEEPPSSIKKHFAGSGRAQKADMIAVCNQLRWAVANDHEADAAGLWSYVKATIDPAFQIASAPLFARPVTQARDDDDFMKAPRG